MPPRTSPRIMLAVLVLTSVAGSSAAGAATAKPVRWWIETHPWTCGAEAGPLARQVQLACDATARCAVASDEGSAERRAVLVCGDEGWTLEAQDAAGQVLWTLALGTTDDQARLRKAGVWIARSEGEGPVDLPPSRTPTIARSPPPASPSEALEPDRIPEDSKAPHLSVATLFHGASPRSDRNDYGFAWGGRALLVGSAPRLTGPLLSGVAATAEYSSEKTEYSLVRGGLVLGLDASLGDFRFGVLVEGGPAHLQIPGAFPREGPGPFGPIYTATHSGLSAWLPYAQASLFVEWSRPGLVHPFASPTATWLIDRGSFFPTQIPNEMLGLDIGLVWGQM